MTHDNFETTSDALQGFENNAEEGQIRSDIAMDESYNERFKDDLESSDLFDRAKKFIANSQIFEALSLLKSHGYEVETLLGRYNELQQKIINGTISSEQQTTETNQIRDSIIKFIQVEKEKFIEQTYFETIHELVLSSPQNINPIIIDVADQQKIARLFSKRVLFVRCQDSKILSSIYEAIVSYHLTQDKSIEIYQPNSDLSLLELGRGRRLEIEYYEKTVVKREVSTIVVIDKPPVYFLNGFEKTYLRAKQIREHLQSKNIALICLLPSSKYEKEDFDKQYRSIQREAKDIFEYWDISYLKHFLETHFTNEAVEYLQTQIKGLNIDEDALYPDIQGISVEGYSDYQKYFDTLRQRVQNRVSTEKDALERLRQQFENGDYLQRVILFIGAFFPGIVWKEFDFLTGFFLQNAPILPAIPPKEGEPIVYELPWMEKWRAKNAELLRSCLLKTISKEEGRVVEFVQPSYGIHFKEFLVEDYYPFIEPWLNQAGNSGFLFGNFSERMQRSIIQLIVTATRSDPTSYDEFWLKNIVTNIKANFDGVDSSNLSSENLITQLLELYQQFAIKQQYKQLFYARLTDLIKELLSEKGTNLIQGIVEKFIKILIDSSDAKADALDIVLRLYRHLKGTPNFNEDFVLNNIKRIINEGDLEQKWRTYISLFQILDLDELFDRMEIWRNAEKQTDFAPVEEYTCRFYYDYSMAQLSEIDEDTYGQTPPPLFHALCNDNKIDTSSRLAVLLDRLFDIRTEHTMRKFLSRQMGFLPSTIHVSTSLLVVIGNDAPQKEWAKLLGNLIEGWTWVVFGVQQKKMISKNDACLDTLFKEIFIRASRELTREIFIWWKQKSDTVYSLKIQEIKTTIPKQQEIEQKINTYILRRDHLMYMRDRARTIYDSINKPS